MIDLTDHGPAYGAVRAHEQRCGYDTMWPAGIASGDDSYHQWDIECRRCGFKVHYEQERIGPDQSPKAISVWGNQ